MTQTFSPELTDAVAAAICARSEAGEGVLAVIKDMGLPDDTLDWLKAKHRPAVEAAKRVQIAAKMRREARVRQA